jgi:hypothetical protein
VVVDGAVQLDVGAGLAGQFLGRAECVDVQRARLEDALEGLPGAAKLAAFLDVVVGGLVFGDVFLEVFRLCN